MDKQKIRLTAKVSLVFRIYMEKNTRKTFYSSSNETEGLLASFTTILESLNVFYKESSIKNPNFLKLFQLHLNLASYQLPLNDNEPHQ